MTDCHLLAEPPGQPPLPGDVFGALFRALPCAHWEAARGHKGWGLGGLGLTHKWAVVEIRVLLRRDPRMQHAAPALVEYVPKHASTILP